MKKLAALVVTLSFLILVAYWKGFDSRITGYSDLNVPAERPEPPVESLIDKPPRTRFKEDLAASAAMNYFEQKKGDLVLNSSLLAVLVDDDISRTKSLRVAGITRGTDFVQYSVVSSDGELGVVTVSPGRVFAFLQTQDGVYEYAGDSSELKLSKSYMTGLEEDFRRSKTKTLRLQQ